MAADERVEIEVVDKVSADVAKKFLDIAAAAKAADSSIKGLQKSLSAVGEKQINSVASAQARMEQSANKTAAALTKLTNESSKTAAAQARLDQATARTAVAQNRAQQSATQLATAQARLSSAQSQAAASADRAAMAKLRLERAQNQATRSSNSLMSVLSQLRQHYIAITAAVTAAYGVINTMDSYVLMENRLRSTGLAGEELTRVFGELRNIANETRGDLQSTVEFYARVAVATKELPYSQQQILQFTRSLQEAVRLSGANVQESTNALIQLSQGLSSGVLHGDELRSVLEQLGPVADVIAKHLGVSRGELRKLGADGKLTSQNIIDAFLKAGTSLDLQFTQQVVTAGQAMTVLKNKLTEALGESGSNFGALSEISKLIMDIGEALDRASPTLEFVMLAVKSTVMMFRTMFVGLQGFFEVALPQALLTFANKALSILEMVYLRASMVLGLVAKVAPNAVGTRITDLLAGSRAGLDAMKAQLNTWNDDTVAAAETLSAKLEDIWGYKPPQAGYVGRKDEAKKRLPAGAGDSKEKITFRIEYEKWSVQSTKDAYAEINKELDEMYATIGMTDRELSIHKKLMDFSEQLPSVQKQRDLLASLQQQLQEFNKGRVDNASLTERETQQRDKLVSSITAQQAIVTQMTESNRIDLVVMKERLELYYLEEERLKRRQAILDSLKKPSFRTTLADLDVLDAQKKITRPQRQEYLVRQNPEIFEGTSEALTVQERQYAEYYKRIEFMRQTHDMSEESASKAKTRLYLEQHKGIIESYSNMFGTIGQLSESSNKRLAAIGRLSATFQVTMDGIVAIQKAWASAPWPANIPAITATTAGTAIQLAKINGLAGFAFGGDFTVGGAGGIDSQTVAFKATPGERVIVQTPEQQANSGKGDTYNFHYHEGEESVTKAERASRYSQFQRMATTVTRDRNSKRSQMELV